MSDLGVLPTAVPPADRPRSDIPIWVLLLAVALMLGLGALVFHELTSPKTTATAQSFPERWDDRVAPLASIAEKERGLRFQHPVEVHFLPAAEFEKTVTSDRSKLTAQDRTEIEHFGALMRAFGLLTGEVDLFDAFNDFASGGTLAYYSFEDKAITVRGEKLTPAVRATMVHELTHVLQDQHFAIGDRVEKLRKKSEHGASTSESTVLDAIIEGDAERVSASYSASLKPKERKALIASQQGENAAARERIAQVPKVIVTMLTSPYTLGQGLVETVAAKGGNVAVDALFRDSPTHESSLLDPFQVLADDRGASKVPTPKLETGEKKFDSGEFGVLTWYLMLAQRIPLLDALAAADGWGGDAFVAFERDGVSCARMSYAGDSPRSTARMYSALRRWVAAPGTPATVSRDGDVVRMESCDPGKAATAGKDASERAVGLVTVRTSLGLGIVRSGLPEKTARCLAGRLVQTYPAAKLVDPKFGAGDRAVQAQIRRLAARCG